ncbi:MAG: hypothetical protein IJ773_08120 [Lachnospiraceae bacterium]|nr:hypothetical protein [Lachnospiraceae bacterium]
MFGYITINQAELKFREYDWYHSFYCGLCRQLKKEYGLQGQMTLTYDMTFLVILLTGLYEPETPVRTARCALHPVRSHEERTNEFTAYTAAMNVLLAYYQCLDDWKDDKNVPKYLMSAALKNAFLRVSKEYPQKAETIRVCLEEISKCEQERDPDVDRASGYFGRLTAEIFAFKEDRWEKDLRGMGFFLGKFIYLMDAYEDLEKDEKSGSYNPFLLRLNKAWTEGPVDRAFFDKDCEETLNMMMAECCRAFERLPVVTGAPVIRNILYSGIWSRFEMVKIKRNQAEKKAQEKSARGHNEKSTR